VRCGVRGVRVEGRNGAGARRDAEARRGLRLGLVKRLRKSVRRAVVVGGSFFFSEVWFAEGGMRARVNRVRTLGSVESRAEEMAALKRFSASLNARAEAKVEETAARAAVESFSAVFSDEESSQQEDGSSTQASLSPEDLSTEELRKKVDLYQLQLHEASELLAEAKASDTLLMKANADLEQRVNVLELENQKLYVLARYMRRFEAENKELRFIMGGLFNPQQQQQQQQEQEQHQHQHHHHLRHQMMPQQM